MLYISFLTSKINAAADWNEKISSYQCALYVPICCVALYFNHMHHRRIVEIALPSFSSTIIHLTCRLWPLLVCISSNNERWGDPWQGCVLCEVWRSQYCTAVPKPTSITLRIMTVVPKPRSDANSKMVLPHMLKSVY